MIELAEGVSEEARACPLPPNAVHPLPHEFSGGQRASDYDLVVYPEAALTGPSSRIGKAYCSLFEAAGRRLSAK